MKKVKLVLEELQVESFEIERDSLRAGTVRGQEHAEESGSGVHSECWTYCYTECERCYTAFPTFCEDCSYGWCTWFDEGCGETNPIPA